MKFEYKIEKDDFVDFQLFTASKSERIHRRKRNTWFFLTLSAVIATVYFYANQNNVMTVYFGVVSVLSVFFTQNISNGYTKGTIKNTSTNTTPIVSGRP